MSIGDATVTEGNAGQAAATFAVTLDRAPAGLVSVDFATQGLTATQGTDFSAASGSVSFAAGQTQKQVIVQVTGDTADEPNEAFRVALSNPQGGITIADGQGDGTITDDDAPVVVPVRPTISVADGSGREGGKIRFRVSLSRAATTPVVVSFATANGSAKARKDYVAKRGRLTIAPGSTSAVVAVRLVNDRLRERAEKFFLKLSAPSGATLADAKGVGTIKRSD